MRTLGLSANADVRTWGGEVRTKSGDTVGARIAQIRGHVSQEVFAREMGVSKNTLGRYENDRVAVDAGFIGQLVKRGYNANWILTGEGAQQLRDASVREESGRYEAAASGRPVTDREGEEIDTHDLATVMQGLDIMLEDEAVEVDYDAKAELVMALYEELRDKGDEPWTPADTRKFIRKFIHFSDHMRKARGQDDRKESGGHGSKAG